MPERGTVERNSIYGKELEMAQKTCKFSHTHKLSVSQRSFLWHNYFISLECVRDFASLCIFCEYVKDGSNLKLVQWEKYIINSS